MKSVILTMGLNHTTAPVQVREQIASAACLRHDALGLIREPLPRSVFPESVVLSTCNRTEVYAIGHARAQSKETLTRLFTSNSAFSIPDSSLLYLYAGRDAVAHLFAVASGLDSMIIGESEILGQVREAYLAGVEHKTVGTILHRLFKDALHVGKRAHSETSIGVGSTSVAYTAVVLARQLLGTLSGRRILILGAGMMGNRAARNLFDNGADGLVIASRTREHAAELAGAVCARPVSLDRIAQELIKADLVISATSAPHIILDVAVVRSAMTARENRPLWMIDLAVPRDIDPQVGQIPNVRLYNIDDLRQTLDRHRATRERAVEQVRGFIEQQVDEFWQWFLARSAAPVLSDLRSRSEEIRLAELEKALRRLNHLNLSERDRKVIAALSVGIVSKLLANPTEQLKNHMQNGDGHLYLQVVSDLFGLAPTDPPAPGEPSGR